MKTVLVFIGLPSAIAIYNYFSLRKDFRESLRNGFIMLGMCVLFSLPVGIWETDYMENPQPVESRMVYVTPCNHHTEDGGRPAYITPIYTNLLELCFSEDEHLIQYCPECYTRKEAIETYIAQR